ncbi:unnamed protein product [Coregonus sp. 'balchen']|nr:unnamed protein product [Coregonus sp. 'balchen']
MPQTNKANSSAAGGPGQVSALDHCEPPPPQAEPRDLAAGDGEDGGEEDQGDLLINKSPSDPKKYRYIELTNGLRVLLISDFSGSDGKDACREEEEGASASGGGEEAEEEGRAQRRRTRLRKRSTTVTLRRRETEQRELRETGCLQLLSVSMWGASVTQRTFQEDMMFMGSEKYPAENGFDAFLKKHGGSDNASTDCERTIFQFDVQRKYFRKALDRWAQFFICPLMIEDAIDREVEAVDRGNAQTLKHKPREKQINTYQQTLNTLEEWVREIFSKVPNNALPRPDFSDLRTHSTHQPTEVHALTTTWTLPPQDKLDRVKPLHYISWLIGHEGTGSILSLLREKCWALALFGGNSEMGFDQNTTYSIFSISERFQNFYQVVHLVFQYMKMLQTVGPQQRIYEEIQKMKPMSSTTRSRPTP